MDIFYRKGILYFTIAILIINITKILGIGYKLTEKEAVYLLFSSPGNYFEYNIFGLMMSIIMFSLTVWVFFFYLDINNIRKRRGI